MKKKVLLGMSGGVDSSVSAILLQEAGYEVIGATMKLWNEPAQSTNGAIEDAKKVCKRLGIEHHVIDLQKEFKKNVVDNFICEYMCGKTPNPCVQCNKYMKFNMFYKIAQDYDCEYIATGHYAKIIYSEKYNQHVLIKSKSNKKDQTYFLYGIDRNILPNILFPLSEFEEKDDIRKIAKEHGLEIATKKDSQEICFISDNNYSKFISEYNKNIKFKTGDILLNDGTVLGKHNGLMHYTVGQRKGLGISYKEPLYVLKLDKENNNVIVGTEKELYSKKLRANELNFLIPIEFEKELTIKAKVRYRANEALAKLFVKDNIAEVEFEEPQRAITPGQSVVFYKDDIVLGGGKII